MVRLTEAQAAKLGINLPRERPSRARPASNRKLTICAVCGGKIYPSSANVRSFGWARNWGWCDAAIGAWVPAHLDCRAERLRQVYEGEYSI